MGRSENQWHQHRHGSSRSLVILPAGLKWLHAVETYSHFSSFLFTQLAGEGFRQVGTMDYFFFLSWVGAVKCGSWFHPGILASTKSTRPLWANRKISMSLFFRWGKVSRTDFGLKKLLNRKLNELFENATLTLSPLEEVFCKMVPRDNRLFMPY